PRQLGIVGEDHSTFYRRHHLRHVEAGDRHVAEGAGHLAAPRAAERASGVLDDEQVVAPSDSHEGVIVAHLAAVINRHDGPRAWGDAALDVVRVDVEGARVDVGQSQPGGVLRDGEGARDVPHRRHDHLVVPPNAQRLEADVQGGRPVVYRDRVLNSHVAGQARLELLDARAHANPSGAQRLHDRLDLLFAQNRLRPGNLHANLPFLSIAPAGLLPTPRHALYQAVVIEP